MNQSQSMLVGMAAGAVMAAAVYYAGGRALANAVEARDWDRVDRTMRLWFFMMRGPEIRPQIRPPPDEDDEDAEDA